MSLSHTLSIATTDTPIQSSPNTTAVQDAAHYMSTTNPSSKKHKAADDGGNAEQSSRPNSFSEGSQLPLPEKAAAVKTATSVLAEKSPNEMIVPASATVCKGTTISPGALKKKDGSEAEKATPAKRPRTIAPGYLGIYTNVPPIVSVQADAMKVPKLTTQQKVEVQPATAAQKLHAIQVNAAALKKKCPHCHDLKGRNFSQELMGLPLLDKHWQTPKEVAKSQKLEEARKDEKYLWTEEEAAVDPDFKSDGQDVEVEEVKCCPKVLGSQKLFFEQRQTVDTRLGRTVPLRVAFHSWETNRDTSTLRNRAPNTREALVGRNIQPTAIVTDEEAERERAELIKRKKALDVPDNTGLRSSMISAGLINALLGEGPEEPVREIQASNNHLKKQLADLHESNAPAENNNALKKSKDPKNTVATALTTTPAPTAKTATKENSAASARTAAKSVNTKTKSKTTNATEIIAAPDALESAIESVKCSASE